MKKLSAKKKKMISKKMSLAEIISLNPKAIEILSKQGFHCFGCQMAQMESLEQGAIAHGLSKKQLDSLLKELNK